MDVFVVEFFVVLFQIHEKAKQFSAFLTSYAFLAVSIHMYSELFFIFQHLVAHLTLFHSVDVISLMIQQTGFGVEFNGTTPECALG